MLTKLGEMYLGHKPEKAIEKLYVSIALRQFAVSMIAIFEPIYLYKIYGSVRAVLFFYTAVYLVYFFVIPFGGRMAARYGFERCISFSIIFSVAYYLAFCGLADNPYMIFLAAFCFIADKAIFRVAYHADIASYGSLGYRGREVGMMSFFETLAGIAGPLLGGLILSFYGFNALFVVVSFLALASIFPMLFTQREFQSGNFSYREAFSNFLNPKDNYSRRDSLAFAGYGEEIVVSVLWPIFVFLTLPDYHIIGFLSTSALFLVAVFKLYAGKLSDQFSSLKKRHWTKLAGISYAIVNFLRYFAHAPWYIFSINFFSDTLKSGITYPYFTYVYSAGGKNDNFLQYAVFYEMSLVLGRVFLGVMLFMLSYYFVGSIFWFIIFLAAAIWSFFYTLLKF